MKEMMTEGTMSSERCEEVNYNPQTSEFYNNI